MFVVHPYSRPIPGLSRDLAAAVDVAVAAAVVLAVTQIFDIFLLAILKNILECTSLMVAHYMDNKVPKHVFHGSFARTFYSTCISEIIA